MHITFRELSEELNKTGPGEAENAASRRILMRVTGMVYRDYVLNDAIAGTVHETARASAAEPLGTPTDINRSSHENLLRIRIFNEACEGKYADAHTDLRHWVTSRTTRAARELSYDESQFLAFVHLVLLNGITS